MPGIQVPRLPSDKELTGEQGEEIWGEMGSLTQLSTGHRNHPSSVQLRADQASSPFSAQPRIAQLSLAQFNSIYLNVAQPSPPHLISAQLRLVQLGLAQFS